MAADENYSDEYLRGILRDVKTVALIGASNKEDRPSYRVMHYLQEHGYRVLPVNPGMAGQKILGETVYAGLADLPSPVEMVDVFRNSEAAGAVCDETITLARSKGFQVVWMQLDVRNAEAAARADAAGLRVVMNRCPKIELARLGK
ncbi:MAG: CoA-binding protein [Alphaproteobacteria bacterium]